MNLTAAVRHLIPGISLVDLNAPAFPGETKHHAVKI
jgi:hypothetical protein